MQSDERLSKLFVRGVEPAFDELARRYRNSLVRFATGIVGRDRAEDVVQGSLVKAHRSMGAEEVRQPRAWLYRVVRNTALNEIRDGARHEHDELEDRALDHLGDPAASEAERREQLASLVAALAELPESQRTALVGRELGGYSHDELATRLGVSTGAAKQLVFRARATLRDALGALMPLPLVAWLASGSASTLIAAGTGAVGTSSAAGLSSAATGSSAGGGVLTALFGGEVAKVATIAVIAGSSVAAGVAVEKDSATGPPRSDRAAVQAAPVLVLETPALVPESVLGPSPLPDRSEPAGTETQTAEKQKDPEGRGDEKGSHQSPGGRPGKSVETDPAGGQGKITVQPPVASKPATGPAGQVARPLALPGPDKVVSRPPSPARGEGGSANAGPPPKNPDRQASVTAGSLGRPETGKSVGKGSSSGEKGDQRRGGKKSGRRR